MVDANNSISGNNSSINTIKSIYETMMQTKKLPIELNFDWFIIIILSNRDYFKKDEPFALEYMKQNKSFFVKAFNLTDIKTQEAFDHTLQKFNNHDQDDHDNLFQTLYSNLRTKETIFSILCSFSLLFNEIITINDDSTISRVQTGHKPNNRLKQILYNFFRKTIANDVGEWYNLVAYTQGELIDSILKNNGFENSNPISVIELNTKIKDSPLKSEYEEFMKGKIIVKTQNKFFNLLKDVLVKDKDLSSIYLRPYNNLIHSTTCNILIAGFFSENDDLSVNWKLMLESIGNTQECYFYGWPAQSQLMIGARYGLTKVLPTILNTFTNQKIKPSSNVEEEQFLISKKTAKDSGKYLAFVLASRQLFKYQTVNLIGFSLGANIIKNCIKQLYHLHTKANIPCNDIIQNVIMLAGATVIKEPRAKDYSDYFNTITSGRVINCFSTHDMILNKLFTMATAREPVGNKELNLPLGKLENYDFSDLGLGHMDYKSYFHKIADRISLNKY